MIKIYQMNEMEWYAGESEEAVKKAIVDFTGLTEEEAIDEDCPRELTDHEMDTLMYLDDPDKPEDSITFREQLDRMIKEGEKFPCIFACTEY